MGIQFPGLPPAGNTALLLPILTPGLPVTGSPAKDTALLRQAVIAALELDLMQPWNNRVLAGNGPFEYSRAVQTIRAGDHAASIMHLERAILEHPMHAAAAVAEPAFKAVEEPVSALIARLSAVARSQAQETISAVTTELPFLPPVEYVDYAKAYLGVAMVHLQSPVYADLVEAVHTATLARHFADRAKPPVSQVRPIRRLWKRLPLLAVLLGWLSAGLLGGLLSAELRHTFFPLWGGGLLVIVLFGFLRSLRTLHSQH
ncbi:MAG TPA: hypothetical protein VMZ52_05960 [Bryobacteraceae bacterium]|nr:hypothetical protein [Bryobacteraceae bacterium]